MSNNFDEQPVYVKELSKEQLERIERIKRESKFSLRKLLTRKNVFISLCVLVAVSFGIYNLLWFGHYRLFNSYLSNPKLTRTDSYNMTYVFKDKLKNNYEYHVTMPPYLKFTGGITVWYNSDVNATRSEWYEIKLYIGFSKSEVFPTQKRFYSLGLGEIDYDLGENITHTRGAEVDKAGQPLGYDSRTNTAENYQKWLELYEEHKDEIMEMFATMREVFGAGAFR